MPPALFFFLKVVLAIWSLLLIQMIIAALFVCFSFLNYLFIYLGCAKSSLQHVGSLLRHVGFSSCGVQALECTGSVVVVRGLSCGMWDLSSPTKDGTLAPCFGSMES